MKKVKEEALIASNLEIVIQADNVESGGSSTELETKPALEGPLPLKTHSEEECKNNTIKMPHLHSPVLSRRRHL